MKSYCVTKIELIYKKPYNPSLFFIFSHWDVIALKETHLRLFKRRRKL